MTDDEELDVNDGKEEEVVENEADDEAEVLDQNAASISSSSRKKRRIGWDRICIYPERMIIKAALTKSQRTVVTPINKRVLTIESFTFACSGR